MYDQYSLMLLSDVCNLQVMGQSLYSIHWNLVSPHFLSIHKFTDKQHSIILELIDELAERVRAIGVKIPTSLNDVFKLKTIQEVCLFGSDQTDYQCLSALLQSTQEAHVHLTQSIAAAGACNDLGTQEILISVEKALAKQIWFIRSQSVEIEPQPSEVPSYE
jgi:starvation-inducible DNA-binding protein